MDAHTDRQRLNLEVAELALRRNLYGHFQNMTTRAHMQRALAHVREATLATEGAANVRSVNQLVGELTGMERFFESLKPKSLDRSCAHEI
jgi:hypothetical protein